MTILCSVHFLIASRRTSINVDRRSDEAPTYKYVWLFVTVYRRLTDSYIGSIAVQLTALGYSRGVCRRANDMGEPTLENTWPSIQSRMNEGALR